MWEALGVALIVALGAFGGQWLTGRQRSREKKEDWKRLDDVKAAAEQTAKLLAESTTETTKQLKTIHTIVNSDRTTLVTTLRTALDAHRAVLMRNPSAADELVVAGLDARVTELDVLLADWATQAAQIETAASKESITVKPIEGA